ncbi:MAG: threonine--tRNA ligase [Armatimonadota bacterium]|nr:threonine--tRNA ligase [Armatimonadota bacterium]MDR5697961.1 threonine--tRNA ligase [Armatimonadota bacterium]
MDARADRVRIRFADGTEASYPVGTRLVDIAKERGERDALAALVNGQPMDLSASAQCDAEVRFLRFDDPQGREIYWHSSAHLMAQAVKELFPDAKLAIGPPIADGFYYDIDIGRPLMPEDLDRIEARMRELARQDQPIERIEIPRDEAIRMYREMGEKYKLELLEDIRDERVSFYRQDGFVDMCRGPHLPSTGYIKAVKLLSTSGAYWRGDERREQLARIYGISFPDEGQLAEHLRLLEEAKRRDHRRLGRELDLFLISEDVGPGLVLWTQRGAVVREVAETFWKQLHREHGYELVYTPHIARAHLWETSGHLHWYRESMFGPMEVEEQRYLIKPMNCPFHMMLYRRETRSYRDLPMRIGELGTVYRYERSGVLHGLLRVRSFTQDDAHIFCRPDQLADEMDRVLDLAFTIYEAFGFRDYRVHLSVRDPNDFGKYAGSPHMWDTAESTLAAVLDRRGLPYARLEGEAVFYGPKIDIHLVDALNRPWQTATVQFDFNLPVRFGLTYVGEDGREHVPYVVHRALFGSMERFFGLLIEHYAGAFPMWLAPEQARLLPIADRHIAHAREAAAALRARGLRADVDGRNEKIGRKIRDAQLMKVPYMLVVGDREVRSGMVAVRHRSRGDLGSMSLEEFARRAHEEIASRAIS